MKKYFTFQNAQILFTRLAYSFIDMLAVVAIVAFLTALLFMFKYGVL